MKDSVYYFFLMNIINPDAYLDLRFGGLFLGLTFFPGGFFPNAEQQPHDEILGDGGSTAGETLPVVLWCRWAPPPLDRLLSIPPGAPPPVLIGLSLSFSSIGLTCSELSDIGLGCSSRWLSSFCSLFPDLLSSAMRRSSNTIPEDPWRRKEIVDLWRPSMDLSLSLLMS